MGPDDAEGKGRESEGVVVQRVGWNIPSQHGLVHPLDAFSAISYTELLAIFGWDRSRMSGRCYWETPWHAS